LNTSTTVWVCFDDAAEYCGFLEFIWRDGGKPFRIIDATGLEFDNGIGRKWTPRSLGVISPERMIEAGLVGRAKLVQPEAIEGYRQLWRRLRSENAPLRVVGRTGLVSAPLTYFDDRVTRYVTNDWRTGARIVADAMVEVWEKDKSCHVSDMWLWGRVCALAEEGVLEINGDSSQIRSAMVRRGSIPP
jgi:Protein of unknown function